jgi:hypothetical protein
MSKSLLFTISDVRYVRLERSGRLLLGWWRTWHPDGLPPELYVTALAGRLLIDAPGSLGLTRPGTVLPVHQADSPLPRIYLGRRLAPLLKFAEIRRPCWLHATIEPLHLVLRPAGVAR